MDDLISRQAAIYAVAELAASMSVCISLDECHGMKRMQGMAVRALNNLPSAQPYTDEEIQKMQDLEQAQLDKAYELGIQSAQPEPTRTFVELVVEYPNPELCTYKKYMGKPYYSIKYIENGETYIGYGTYKPEVLSQYLKEYFISSAQPETRWIPRSSTERPKNKEEVMVTIDDGYKRYTDTDEYINGHFWYHDDKHIVAWKSFDEPWRGEQE